MSHRDRDSRSSSGVCTQELSQAVGWLLGGITWKNVQFRRDCGWTARALATAALLWAWSSEASLQERLHQALEVARRICGRAVPKSLSYQAFIKLLVRWTEELHFEMFCALRTRMKREFPGQFRLAGFVVLAGDGSKVAVPRTTSNEARFSPSKTRRQRKSPHRRGRRARSRKVQQQRAREKKADSPQMALTALFHVGLRLPWDWRIGASDESERDHLRDMIPDLPSDALVTADCGFVGYDFWSALLDSQREFVIRVGGNVRLLKQLGVVRESAGTIYLWPDKFAKRQRPPLVLRLVVVQGARHPWFLVTSVRDPKRLSDRQVADIYRRRWGIELFFRHFKQTFGRGKLRSHKAEHATCELQWSLFGLWTMLLYAQKHLPLQPASPPRLSVARVLRAFRRVITNRRNTNQSLAAALADAVVDHYPRQDKRSRGYPRKKYEPPTKAPRMTSATQTQRTLAQQLASQLSKKRLPA
jgi:hypothetical protein